MDHRRLRTFLFGGAIGALAGILLAPRSGRELRGSFVNRAGEARERSRETYFQAQERMQERLASAREGSHRPPSPEDEAVVGAAEVAREPAASRPPLRDVSWEAQRRPAGAGSAEEAGETPEDGDPEDLRRRVREARARLRARLDQPGRPDAASDEDRGE